MKPTTRIAILLEQDEKGLHPVASELYGLATRLTNAESIVALVADASMPYPAAAFAESLLDAVKGLDAALLLIGATPFSKQIAPYLAVSFETGLSADCTDFCWTPDGRLRQIRPAFDGAALAWVLTENSLPRIATVRPGAFRSVPLPENVSPLPLKPSVLPGLEVGERRPLPPADDIARAERIIAIGGGLQKKEEVALFAAIADRYHAALACSRAITERGWMPQSRQIGLSGHAVRPAVLITFGISGSTQFLAGVQQAAKMIAVNNDPQAPIFAIAQQSILGDLYEIAQKLLD